GGLSLGATDLRVRADPLERPLGLAADVRAGTAGDVLLLARGRPAHEHPPTPRGVRGFRALQRRVREAALPLHRRQPPRRRGDARPVLELVSAAPAPAGAAGDLRTDGQGANRGVRLPAAVAADAPRGGGGRCGAGGGAVAGGGRATASA